MKETQIITHPHNPQTMPPRSSVEVNDDHSSETVLQHFISTVPKPAKQNVAAVALASAAAAASTSKSLLWSAKRAARRILQKSKRIESPAEIISAIKIIWLLLLQLVSWQRKKQMVWSLKSSSLLLLPAAELQKSQYAEMKIPCKFVPHKSNAQVHQQ
jgi:hypothetical protein